jgi:hypothetical protein
LSLLMAIVNLSSRDVRGILFRDAQDAMTLPSDVGTSKCSDFVGWAKRQRAHHHEQQRELVGTALRAFAHPTSLRSAV